ncbi:MAG TPA: S46 family peptidase, partial [Myxococcales bacterium]|nr:S46 family peptidase [Myxococcales bacterium]
MKRLAPLCALLLGLAARADEGMWTYDNFPSRKVQAKYGFSPDAGWLSEAQLSSVRLAGGCSGSFVSPEGLVMTNHHCAHSCIEQLSTKDKDFVAQGFYAPALENEVKCPEIELNQLTQISDVTARVQGATKGLKPGKEFNDKRKAAMADIEKECSAGSDKVRCDVVELYHGGQYSLYKYRRFQDVRLVFAPEFAIAFFGGDPDNFNFPRYDLDVSFIRAWEDGKPAKTDHYFKWSPNGAKEGELTFVSGHPGGT